jgi:diguanylate cyclase (GGDEF)-like protein
LLVNPPIAQTKTRIARQAWLVLLASSLMAGGVVLALRALSFDSEVHRRYEYALTLSQAALEAQQSSADLRSWQERNARGQTRGTEASVPAAEFASLGHIAAELRGRLARLAQLDMPADHLQKLAQLQQSLLGFEVIARRAAEPGGGGAEPSRAALLASSADFDALEHSLTELVSSTHARAAASARQAEGLNDTARVALIAFSATALLLALTLIGLTLRTLRANNALLDRMSHLAQEDGLTGIANRRTLDESLPVEFARALRSGQPLTLVMMDLDHFKRYNDRRGHAAGDALLRGAAQAWLKQMRPTDLLARYGGEEFTLVLPACTADQAAQLVDRLRPLMPDRQTFSAGIATWEASETPTELLQRADRALSLAKKGGRNRTMIAGRELQATLPLEMAATS